MAADSRDCRSTCWQGCLLAMYSRQVNPARAASVGDPTAAKNLGRLGIFQLDEDAPSEQVCRLDC